MQPMSPLTRQSFHVSRNESRAEHISVLTSEHEQLYIGVEQEFVRWEHKQLSRRWVGISKKWAETMISSAKIWILQFSSNVVTPILLLRVLVYAPFVKARLTITTTPNFHNCYGEGRGGTSFDPNSRNSVITQLWLKGIVGLKFLLYSISHNYCGTHMV